MQPARYDLDKPSATRIALCFTESEVGAAKYEYGDAGKRFFTSPRRREEALTPPLFT
jgi:hypothetical protein